MSIDEEYTREYERFTASTEKWHNAHEALRVATSELVSATTDYTRARDAYEKHIDSLRAV